MTDKLRQAAQQALEAWDTRAGIDTASKAFEALRASQTLSELVTTPQPQPKQEPREHITDGSPCWCNPEVDYIDPETGAAVIVHRRPQ